MSKAAANDVMAKTMRKIGFRIGLLMNTFNTIVFTTIGTLRSGHFTWSGWLFGGVVGWITGFIITSIIPVKQTQDKVLEKTKTDPNSVKGKILASLTTNFIIMPAMTCVMGIAMPMMSVKGMERGIAATETELVQLQQQQEGLKSQQAELQGKYDAMKIDIDDLQAKIDAAASPAEKAPLEGELEGKTKALDEMQSGITEMQNGIDGMQGGIDSMTESINARKGAAAGIKNSIFPSLPFNILFMTAIGITLGFIIQPLFMKLVFKSVLGTDSPPA